MWSGVGSFVPHVYGNTCRLSLENVRLAIYLPDLGGSKSVSGRSVWVILSEIWRRIRSRSVLR